MSRKKEEAWKKIKLGISIFIVFLLVVGIMFPGIMIILEEVF